MEQAVQIDPQFDLNKNILQSAGIKLFDNDDEQ